MFLIIALLSVACTAHADAFRPWGLNDSKAFVFPRIAEKRNRARHERLAAALRNDVAFGGPCGQPRSPKARGLGRVRMAPPASS